MASRAPVLIVGAGAAGLATSALLAKYGVRSMLIEKRAETLPADPEGELRRALSTILGRPRA